MNDDSQHELDDELLSAYLDDELAADERALVERRLAADPAARQTLEQLRNVSQAVRGLPQEVVGRDLREIVLQRVPCPRLGVGMEAPSGDMPTQGRGHGTLPKLSIGRTTRGWVWASLAVAAALLIMIFQSGGEREGTLPEIAQRWDKRSDNGEKQARGPAELWAGNEPGAAEVAPSVSSPSPAEPIARNFADGRAAIAPAAPADSSSLGGEQAVDHLTASPQADMPDENAGTTLGAPLAPSPPAGPIDEEQVVVVHVRAKRAAFENKVFDQLLASNEIVVDAEDGAAGAAAASRDQREEQVASGRVAGKTAEQAAAEEADVDMVLVEAPPNLIMSCMKDLNQDSSNYLGLSVDDWAPADEASALETPPTRKLAMDLGKFNRGMVPQQQKDAFARDKSFYYRYGGDGRNGRSGLGIGGGFGGAGDFKQEAGQSPARESDMDRGRARRVQARGAEFLPRSERSEHDIAIAEAESLKEAVKLQNGLRELKSRAGTDRERLQVLFVLRPDDEPAPSPPAADRAE